MSSSLPLLLPAGWNYFPTGSPIWLLVNVSFNFILGGSIYLAFVILLPRLRRYTEPYYNPGAFKGKGGWVARGADLYTWKGIWYQSIYLLWFAISAFAFVYGMVGTLFTLLLSVGMVNPLSIHGFVYDIIFARANGQPNGAHIPSYVILVVFGFVVCYKFRHKPLRMLEDIMGDPFQGIAAAGFLGAIHEILWIGLYYLGYWQYLSWTDLPEVIRDFAFVGLLVLLIATFWKIPNRKFPLSIFKWPIVVYSIYLLVWFFLPGVFGYHVLPITTINNPQFGTGLYQQTPWWGIWWVNTVEVGSWLILGFSFIYVVIKYKKPINNRLDNPYRGRIHKSRDTYSEVYMDSGQRGSGQEGDSSLSTIRGCSFGRSKGKALEC